MTRKYLTLAAALLASAAPLSAETLREAMEMAYHTNPTLAAARAGQRANDENVPIARARGLPNSDLNGTYNENVQTASNSFAAPTRLVNAQVSVNVPLYSGGGVRNAIRAAEVRVKAGEDSLRATEADVFTAVVGAYMDVLRDQSVVELNRGNVKVLQTNLEATNDRFQVGDLTRTDVAQSEARLALAQSQLESAEAQLISSLERYVQVVGKPPQGLLQPPPLPNMPATSEQAVGIALDENPDLAAMSKTVDAAKYDVKSARAARLPRVQAVAQDTYSNFLGSLQSDIPGVNFQQGQNSALIGLQVSVPIYQGGGPSAQIRQAQARTGQAAEQMIEVERSVIAQTRAAYANWRAANAVIVSTEKAVAANKLSLEGVRAENSVGTRTVLDILNAEQELLNTQVQLVGAQRNAYVAGFQLVAAMGGAEARDLGLDGGALYDPAANFRRVRRKIWDWSDDPDPVARSTRTVDTPTQTSDKAP